MRRESAYLFDIVDAVAAIQRFVTGMPEDQFVQNDLVRSAVIAKLLIVGEAASQLSQATRDKYPEVPWPQIRGFRNTVIHAYHGVNWQIVWNAATKDAVQLAAKAQEILRKEFPGAEPLHP